MNRRDDAGGEGARKDLTALLHQLELRTEHGLRGGGAEADDDGRVDGAQLRFEPRATRLDLGRARLLVDPPLPPRLPLEVFDGVGDIDLIARNTGIRERLVEHRAGRSDKGLSLPIFLVARLLADKHHARRARAGAEHDLRGGLVEITSARSEE